MNFTASLQGVINHHHLVQIYPMTELALNGFAGSSYA